MSEVEEQVQGEGGAPGADGPMPHEGAPPVPPAAEPEAAPRERREYVVLLRERPDLLDAAATALRELVEQKIDDDPAQETLLALVEELAGERGLWGELGTVEAFNRAGALEEVEKRWPAALEGTPTLHLIPSRFWQEVTPEEQPPPPPRRKWKGV